MILFWYKTKSTSNKNKTSKGEKHQKHLLQSKINGQQNGKSNLESKRKYLQTIYIWKGVNVQNIYKINPVDNLKIQLKMGRETE